jgi:hypothetical protein
VDPATQIMVIDVHDEHNLLERQVPRSVTAAKRLGHSQIGVTVDSYAHLLRGVGRDAAERAAALVPRGPRDQSVTNRVGRPVQPNASDSRGEGVGAVHGPVDRLGVGGAVNAQLMVDEFCSVDA